MSRTYLIWAAPVALAVGLGAVLAADPPEGSQPAGEGTAASSRRNRLPPVHAIPPFVEDKLNLTPEQEKQLDDLEAEMRSQLSKILTPDQKKQWRASGPPRGPH